MILLSLAVVFTQLSILAFGGVLPLAHQMVVEDQKWLNTEEFTH